MRIRSLAVTLILFAAVASAQTPVNPTALVPRISVSELREKMQKGEAVAVDVRGDVLFGISHIEGAVSMPLGSLLEHSSELPEDKLIVPYCSCKAEELSGSAVLELQQAGFKKVAALRGGFHAWSEAGYPVYHEPADPTPPPPPVPYPSPAEGAPAASPESGGRLRPPAALNCDRNALTSYEGVVTKYRRSKGKTVVTLKSEDGTTHTATLLHRGTDDPSASFLLDGQPFTPAGWKAIEASKGKLRSPAPRVVFWLCGWGPNARTTVDWHPHSAE